MRFLYGLEMHVNLFVSKTCWRVWIEICSTKGQLNHSHDAKLSRPASQRIDVKINLKRAVHTNNTKN